MIGIICLIAAVLTPSLLGQMARARYRAAQLQLDTVASAVEEFRSDVGRYPTQVEGLQSLVAQPTDVGEGWAGPYVRDRKTLSDPWGRPILYTRDEQSSSFFVQSYGADGRAGGAGVNHDLRSPAAP